MTRFLLIISLVCAILAGYAHKGWHDQIEVNRGALSGAQMWESKAAGFANDIDNQAGLIKMIYRELETRGHCGATVKFKTTTDPMDAK